MTRVPTARLDLDSVDLPMLDAAIAGRDALAAHLAASVPVTWPPETLDADAYAWFRERLVADPSQESWWMYFVLRREADGSRSLVGSVGFKGPPDADGMVEIGYGMVRDEYLKGYASEAAGALVARAFADSAVHRVIAETLPELIGSMGVMRRCGMRPLDEVPNEPGGVRYGITRAEFEQMTGRGVGSPA